jgi:glycine cleavage system H protein
MPKTTQMRFTATHEWVRPYRDRFRVGITAFGQQQLGDILYVELPVIGAQERLAGDEVCVLESTKAAAGFTMPLRGRITKVNDQLRAHPAATNKDPYGAGWLFEIQAAAPSDFGKLLDSAAYQRLVSHTAKQADKANIGRKSSQHPGPA